MLNATWKISNILLAYVSLFILSKPKTFGAPKNLNQNLNFYPTNFVTQMIPYKSNM